MMARIPRARATCVALLASVSGLFGAGCPDGVHVASEQATTIVLTGPNCHLARVEGPPSPFHGTSVVFVFDNQCNERAWLAISWRGQDPFDGSCRGFVVGRAFEVPRGRGLTATCTLAQGRHCEHTLLLKIEPEDFDFLPTRPSSCAGNTLLDHVLDYMEVP
jgi:hypothetical protein